MSKYLCKPASRREWASRQAQEELRKREKHGENGETTEREKTKGTEKAQNKS